MEFVTGIANRRLVLGLMGAGVAGFTFPRLLLAQAAKMPTVAVLFIGDSDDDELSAKPFFDAMTRFGWVEGKRYCGFAVPR